MITQCPHCRQQYEVDNQFDGQIVECQDCRQEFVIEKFENNIVLRKIQKAHPPEKRKIKWYQKIFIGLGIFIFWLGIVFIISAKTDITKSVVAYCISGSRPIKNPSISLLLKVFPQCKIDLDGHSYISNADHGGVSVQDISVSGNGNNFFSATATNSLISRICDAIMLSDIPAEAKVKVYQIIKDIENTEKQQ